MLETLTRGFQSARERLGNLRELTEENIADALRDVRMSLLEADVDLEIVRGFLDRVRERALGEKLATRVADARGRKLRVGPGELGDELGEERRETGIGGRRDPDGR